MSGIKKLFGRAEQVDVLDPASEALIKSLEAQKQLGAEHFESGPTLGEWPQLLPSFFFSGCFCPCSLSAINVRVRAALLCVAVLLDCAFPGRANGVLALSRHGHVRSRLCGQVQGNGESANALACPRGRSRVARRALTRVFFLGRRCSRLLQGAYVAVKKLKKVEVLRLKQVEHVMNEKAILLGVTHPFIVNLWATFQDLGSLYLVMEFVQGGEVFSHLRKLGRFSPEITRVFSAEVCLALEHLHSFDVIYRDLYVTLSSIVIRLTPSF